MPYQFTVSPDFTPDHLSGWYIFNTWLQKQIAEAIHLEMYASFQAQHQAIQNNQVDLIYANPFDAAMLVREKGFLPLVKAASTSDEAIIAVNTDHAAQSIEDLCAGIKLAVTDDPDVRLMGMIMLEPADLNVGNIITEQCDSYVLVAKQLLRAQADAGIFLAEAYDGLSSIIKKQLRVLVRSQISIIHHALLIGPQFGHRRDEIQQLLLGMNQEATSKDILDNLGFSAWQKVDDEDMEFMIDLMDTLSV
jgi:phosphonate transport system substrate-binding protein